MQFARINRLKSAKVRDLDPQGTSPLYKTAELVFAKAKIVVTFEVATIAQVRKLEDAWRAITTAAGPAVEPALHLEAQARALVELANQIGRDGSELLREAMGDLLEKYDNHHAPGAKSCP
jgi:hypothetical protein